VDPAGLAGNMFFKVEAAFNSCLLTFDGDLTRPVYFREEDSGAVEVSASVAGAGMEPLTLKLPGDWTHVCVHEMRMATVALSSPACLYGDVMMVIC